MVDSICVWKCCIIFFRMWWRLLCIWYDCWCLVVYVVVLFVYFVVEIVVIRGGICYVRIVILMICVYFIFFWLGVFFDGYDIKVWSLYERLCMLGMVVICIGFIEIFGGCKVRNVVFYLYFLKGFSSSVECERRMW